ncbi:histidinol-phosphate transaminase [Methanobrevibacter curvatus]|uniref:Histidinol-phosphate aminotransferase n=1 Tax=Methanobrevibacter curvatus TaxID=49547 RepID=A0A166CN01_9EURY|nr:histidinol-phosphate transaminase [Methanobrevibacter curvatus]KZX14681.1 histidinol-phosphate aminotransferase [Methanobrevibacter curvatus]
MKLKKVIGELDPYVPGRSQDEIANEFGLKKEEIIKLGSNENPWGSSKKSIEAISNELQYINRYPETNLNDLKEEIARYTNLKVENVIIGGDGADEIIDSLAKTFIEEGDEFIVPLPSYTYYEYTFKPYGAVPVYGKWDLEKNTVDVDSVLEAISNKTKVIFLCSPNNPTGGIINKKDIETIVNATDALVVIDEAYVEFSVENNVDLIIKYDNVLIMRTMSKVMGLAGLRIGYALSNKKLIEYIHRVKPAFSLTRLSYIAALETFRDKLYINESISNGITSRNFLYFELSKFSDLNVLDSKANYILIGIRDTGMNAAKFSKELLKRGVIVRDCTSFKGLDEYWIRISIGTMEENEKFIGILHDFLDNIS